jgi:hypothetical protein
VTHGSRCGALTPDGGFIAGVARSVHSGSPTGQRNELWIADNLTPTRRTRCAPAWTNCTTIHHRFPRAARGAYSFPPSNFLARTYITPASQTFGNMVVSD